MASRTEGLERGLAVWKQAPVLGKRELELAMEAWRWGSQPGRVVWKQDQGQELEERELEASRWESEPGLEVQGRETW